MSVPAVRYCVSRSACNMAEKKRQPNLAKAIFVDLLRHKLLILLLTMNVVTGLLIVQFTHMSRSAISEQDRLNQQRDELNTDWRHYVLEQRTLSEHSRVEAKVKAQLGLYRPAPKDEVMVTIQ